MNRMAAIGVLAGVVWLVACGNGSGDADVSDPGGVDVATDPGTDPGVEPDDGRPDEGGVDLAPADESPADPGIEDPGPGDTGPDLPPYEEPALRVHFDLADTPVDTPFPYDYYLDPSDGHIRLDAGATERYWVNHMYSWLRNTPPNAYYGSRPYYCPEVAGFMPTLALKQAIPMLHEYVRTNADFAKAGMRVKGMDVYFSPNAAFLWVDTLYPEMSPEAKQVGLKVRSEIAELLSRRLPQRGGKIPRAGCHLQP